MSAPKRSTLGGVGWPYSAVRGARHAGHAATRKSHSERLLCGLRKRHVKRAEITVSGDQHDGADSRRAAQIAPTVSNSRAGLSRGRSLLRSKVPLAVALHLLRDARSNAGPCFPNLPSSRIGYAATGRPKGLGARFEYRAGLLRVQQHCEQQPVYQHPRQAGLHSRQAPKTPVGGFADAGLVRSRDSRVEPRYEFACPARSAGAGEGHNAVQLASHSHLSLAIRVHACEEVWQ